MNLNAKQNAWLKFFIKMGFACMILWLIISQIDFNKFVTNYKSIPFLDLIYAMIIIIIGNLIFPAVISWRSLKAGSLALSLWELIRVNFAIRFYSLFMPAGIVTGIRWYKYRNKGKGSDALALVVFEKLIQMFILIGFAVVFLGKDHKTLGPEGNTLFAISLIVLTGIFLCFIPFCIPRSRETLTYIFNGKNIFFPKWLTDKINRMITAIKGFGSFSFFDVSFILLLSFFGHILCIWGGYVLIEAICPQLDISAFAWMRSVILFMALMPITVGNLGIREAGYIYLMGLYGVPAESSFAFSLSLFTVQILTGLMGGCFEGLYFLFVKEK